MKMAKAGAFSRVQQRRSSLYRPCLGTPDQLSASPLGIQLLLLLLASLNSFQAQHQAATVRLLSARNIRGILMFRLCHSIQNFHRQILRPQKRELFVHLVHQDHILSINEKYVNMRNK